MEKSGYMAESERRVKRVVLLSLALALGIGDAQSVAAQGQGLFGAGAAYLGVGASGIATGELDGRLAEAATARFSSSVQSSLSLPNQLRRRRISEFGTPCPPSLALRATTPGIPPMFQ